MTLKFNELQQRLKEAKQKTLVFSFGRMNPPTIGHEKLVNVIKKEASARKADARLYLSHTTNKEKDPLTYAEKAKYAKKAFDIFKQSKARTIIEVAKEIEADGYTDLVMVFGEDRDAEMVNLLKRYNGKDFNFNSITNVSAGKRDPKAKGVEGISGTKLRELAKTGQVDDFKKALASKLSDREKTAIYNQIRKVYSIKDNVVFDRDELREAYLIGELFNVGDIVYDMNENKEYEIIEQGPNFVYCMGEDGNVYTKWLSDLTEKKSDKDDKTEVRQDKDIGDKGGTQPAKYYAGLKSKSTKSSRDAHFKKNADKSDSDPSAYKPAPGDATAKTKPSTHTKKFKAMFGEKLSFREHQQLDEISEQTLVEAAEIAFEVEIEGIGTMLVAGSNKQEVKQRLQKMFRDARKFSIGKRLMDPQIKMWYRSKAGDKPQVDESRITHAEEDELREEWNIDLFLEEEEEINIPEPNEVDDEDLEKEIAALFDKYDEIEDVADVYPDKDLDGIPDDQDNDGDGVDVKGDEIVDDDEMLTADYEWVDDLDEVLTPAQRMKRAQLMRRMSKRIQRKRKIALKRMSSPEKLRKRARRHARNRLRKRFTKGKPYSSLGMAQKAQIEKFIKSKRKVVDRLSIRLLPTMRRLEMRRLNAMKSKKEEFMESTLIETNEYRVGSEMYYETFNEWKALIQPDDLSGFDRELLESDIGSFAMYEGNHVPLDCPMMEEEKQPELNKPKAGGPKKYYVYVKDPSSGNIKKVSWGDTSGLKIKLNDPEARKSFAARHQCDTKKDKTKPGYWACRMPYFAKQLGLSGGGNFFW